MTRRPEAGTPPSGRLVGALLALVVAALAIEALVPFRTEVPGRRGNGAHRAGATIVFEGPNRVRTAAPPPWLADVRDGAPFRVALTAVPGEGSQVGPARLLTISRDYEQADLAIAQYEQDLIVRVRRAGSDPSGEPPARLADVFDTGVARRIEVRRLGAVVTVSVDGRDAGRLDLGPEGLSRWRTDFRLALGDEHLGSRAWIGTLSEATVEVAGRRWDYLAGEVEIPRHYWYVPERVRLWAHLSREYLAASALHGASFIPLGVLVVLHDRRRRTRRAIAVVAAFSSAIVVGKVFVEGRHPTLVDLVAQAAGGGLAAASTAWLLAWRERRSAAAAADPGLA